MDELGNGPNEGTALSHCSSDETLTLADAADLPVIDPVRSMKLDPAAPDAHLEAQTVAAAETTAIYTCPMHPQIRQKGPGSCPICGMALEPRAISAEAVPNYELADMTRRFSIGLALTLPVFILEMGGHIQGLGLHHLVPPATSTWIQFVLATPVVLWAGWPFFQRGWALLVGRHLNMFTLIALGTGVAYLYSLVATFAPGVFPAGFTAWGAPLPSTTRRRRSSPSWCCSARCWNCGFGTRPVVPSGPRVRLRLQRHWHSDRGGRALPRLRRPAQPGRRRTGDVVELGVGHRKCAAAARCEAGLRCERPGL